MKTHLHSLLLACLTAMFFALPKAYSNSSPQSFTINCPGNVYVSCTDELWDLSIYGNATYTLNYYTYSAGAPVVSYHLNSCNVGYIKRTWSVEDPYWNIQTCTQFIYVSSTANGGPQITWPKDYELTGCNPNTDPSSFPSGYGFPTWVDSECSVLGRSYSDMVFTVNSQCKKIMRTWKIRNWCANGYSSNETYSYNQIIKIYVNDPPKPNCIPEILVNSLNCKNAELITNALAIDPSTCGGTFEITNNSPYATSKGANISGTYPIGTTKVTYSIKYGCGGIKLCHTNVVVKNASKPTPYCIGSLITALMPLDTDKDNKIDDGMVEIWAKDFDKGSKSPCGFYPLTFSFAKDAVVMNRTFTCDHIGKNLIPVYVTDSKGGQSYCLTEITIQNNGANIPDCHPAPPPPPPAPKYVVRGNVFSVSDAPLSDALVTVKFNQPTVTYTIKYDTTTILKLDSFYNQSGYKLYRYVEVRNIVETKDSTVKFETYNAFTNTVGKYSLDSLTQRGKSLGLTAQYKDAVRKGIDNKDVELLTKFLLGEVTFNSYHQYLAADIDENGVIDVKDQNALMAFVTNAVDSLPGKKQWYVLPANTAYTNAKDVLTLPINYISALDSLKKDSNVVNFVGIKKGNISVDPGDLAPGTIVASRNAENLEVFPNPFYDAIKFKIKSNKDNNTVRIKVYNVNGAELINSQSIVSTGDNEVIVNGQDLPLGLLLYQVTVGDATYSGRLIHTK